MDHTFYIENLSIQRDGENLKLYGYIGVKKDGAPIGMERVRLNSVDNEDLKECLDVLADLIAEIS